jgi:prepilin-type N-terminal cleavage/methylation domain-containing protein
MEKKKSQQYFYRYSNNKIKFNKNRAFTLVEVLISAVISGLILASIYTILFLGKKAWEDYSNNILPKQEVRRGLIWMVSELREARDPIIIKDAHSIRINFERPLVGPVSYVWSDNGVDADKIIRINYLNQRTLANGITLLSFISPTDNEIIVSISAGKKQNYNLNEEVALRSKTSLFMQGRNEFIK